MAYTTHCGDRDTGNARFRKAITMKDAKTLLLEFLAAVTHGQDAAALPPRPV